MVCLLGVFVGFLILEVGMSLTLSYALGSLFLLRGCLIQPWTHYNPLICILLIYRGGWIGVAVGHEDQEVWMEEKLWSRCIENKNKAKLSSNTFWSWVLFLKFPLLWTFSLFGLLHAIKFFYYHFEKCTCSFWCMYMHVFMHMHISVWMHWYLGV